MGLKRSAADELRRTVTFVTFVTFATVGEVESRPWASATFAGERHRLTLTLTGPAAEAGADSFLNGLGERDFPMRGHILIDIACVGDERREDTVRLTLEALTVEDD
jgi:hypothetical protein